MPLEENIEINLPEYNIYEVFSQYSYRPEVQDDFNYQRNSDLVIRIASWNLDNFSLEKARNLGVIEVICCTILENKFSIVSIQEVKEPLALKMVCDELNRPSIKCLKTYTPNSRCWKYCLCNENNNAVGFIYDSYSNGIGVDISHFCNNYNLDNEVGSVTFLVKGVPFIILTKNTFSHSFEDFFKDIPEKVKTGPVLIVCDVNGISANEMIKDLKSIVPLWINTSYPHLKTSLRFTDTILIDKVCQTEHFTGCWGIVREGLIHLAIPDGWDWGGAVSTHCPVWGEFYVHPNECIT